MERKSTILVMLLSIVTIIFGVYFMNQNTHQPISTSNQCPSNIEFNVSIGIDNNISVTYICGQKSEPQPIFNIEVISIDQIHKTTAIWSSPEIGQTYVVPGYPGTNRVIITAIFPDKTRQILFDKYVKVLPLGSTPIPIQSPITPGPPISTPITPTPSILPPSTTPASGQIAARIDQVNTKDLKLGTISFADITITNTGTVPITKERVETIAGKDFGFLIGYQSRAFIQDFNYNLEPGQSTKLVEQFSLPSYEGPLFLGGVYDVSIRIYANDYFVAEWNGKASLNP